MAYVDKYAYQYDFEALRQIIDDLEQRALKTGQRIHLAPKEITRRYGLPPRHLLWKEFNRLMAERGFAQRSRRHGQPGWLVALPVRDVQLDGGEWLLRSPPSLLYG